MGEQTSERAKKQICAGVLAHVDAGKTTLSEGLLFAAGRIRRLGRVDRGDAFLDTDELERARGITIFSKQAELVCKDTAITLLDTPGHVDFSAETERTLQVLDYAMLVISGSDGVQAHTATLWRLLARHKIPVFLFVNKMDQPGCDRGRLMHQLREKLNDGCVDFTDPQSEAFLEEAAMCEEELLDAFLETGTVEKEEIRRLIRERKLFPCYFGSALKMQGVEEFLDGFCEYTEEPLRPDTFGARVFKIMRDEQGGRLTYLKVTGGSLKVRDTVSYEGRDGKRYEEKIAQIRRYSGSRSEALTEAPAGTVCAVGGLSHTVPGQGLGGEGAAPPPVLEPVLNYRLGLPPGTDARGMLPKLRQLEEEEPELSLYWDEKYQEIQVRIMGEVQLEILHDLILRRFGVEVSFGDGHILYRETIASTVEGVGHFEPLRHYAEVHLLLAPGERGSGLVFDSECSEDVLARNWQRLVLTHLAERVHKGVLTGAPVTDMKITLINGRAHQKHTEGGDFRQATYRAVRQGLMQAENVLLEPWYDFVLTVPAAMVGRAMTDIENRHGIPQPPQTEGEFAVLAGIAPVAAMRNYQKDVNAYTRGRGQLALSFHGYLPCHNAEEVIARSGYVPEYDMANPCGSVFCTHGSGYYVEWNEVWEHMHLPCRSDFSGRQNEQEMAVPAREEKWIGTDEIDAIIARTFYANGKDRSLQRKGIGGRREFSKKTAEEEPVSRPLKMREKKPEYLLVDGYNIIFAWEPLAKLAAADVEGARGQLLDIMSNYQGLRRCEIIVVFDAYRVQGHETEIRDYLNIHVVFTKEAETADQYIEKFTHENIKKYDITVATSDGLEQIIIRGAGCRLMSAADLREEIRLALSSMRETIDGRREDHRRFFFDTASEEVLAYLAKLRREDR